MAPLRTRKPESFDGSIPETWPIWVAQFEAFVTANSDANIAEPELALARLKAMPAFLTQHAFQMYEELEEAQKDTYEHLVENMNGKMDIGQRQMSWITQMRRAERKSGESIESFVGRLSSLAKQAYPNATVEERLKHINECFVLGQPSGLLFELLKKGGTDLEANKKNAKLYEAAKDLATEQRGINLVEEEGAQPNADLGKKGWDEPVAYCPPEGNLSDLRYEMRAEFKALRQLVEEFAQGANIGPRVLGPFRGICYYCGQNGHMARQCNGNKRNQASRF